MLRILALLVLVVPLAACATEKRTEAVYGPAPAYSAPSPCAPAAPGLPPRCEVPGAYSAPYGQPIAYRTETSMRLSSQGAQAVNVIPGLVQCGAGFIRCAWDTVLSPILPTPGPTQAVAPAYGAGGCK